MCELSAYIFNSLRKTKKIKGKLTEREADDEYLGA